MEESTLIIERLSLKGDGVARVEGDTDKKGLVAFVPYTLPGEKVRAKPLFIKKNHSRWIPTQILMASQDRRAPACPVHFAPQKNRFCGGCDWQALSLVAQRREKTTLLKETLERIGGLKDPTLLPLLGAEDEWRYRNKVQVPVGGVAGNIRLGFYQPDSHILVPFDDCPVQPTLSVTLLKTVQGLINRFGWEPYDEDRHRGLLRHILIRTNNQGQALVTLVTAGPEVPGRMPFVGALLQAAPAVIGIHQNIQTDRTHVILGRRWVKWWGSDQLDETLGGLKISFSAGSFFQVNTAAAAHLFEKAVSALELKPSDTVLDLYCGVGVMTLMAARKAGFVVGVENARSSIADAKQNAKKNGITNATFTEADAAAYFRSDEADRLEKGGDFKVLVDPPRSGLDGAVIAAFLERRPERIVYVSCDPATLARDVKLLSSHYEFQWTVPVDMFPQTSHIESVTLLRRKSLSL